MAKYEPLRDHLAARGVNEIAMSFSDIERVIGAALPAAATEYRAWWSNNPSNNVMTKAWLAAGFRTERVDMAERRLVFRRIASGPGGGSHADLPDQEGVGRGADGRHRLFGYLKGSVRVEADVDLTAPADPDWGASTS